MIDDDIVELQWGTNGQRLHLPRKNDFAWGPIIENCVVCEITEVMPNSEALFEDPFEGDRSLYPGSYVQWSKAHIHSKGCKISIKLSRFVLVSMEE